jgi:hypothetical protein
VRRQNICFKMYLENLLAYAHCLLFIFEHEILHTSGVPLNMARLGDKPTVELVNGRITFVYNLTFLRILWNAVMSLELCFEGCSV